ncbi:MAG: response regulator transcription factor [Chloroflexota bacterium]
MSEKINVLLVDDQRLVREGLRMLLELESNFHVVGEASDGVEGLALYAQMRPDVVLMDVRMPNMDGVEATRQLCAQYPEARILILTTFDDDAYIFEGIRSGALGYMLKDVSGEELANAVRAVAAGGSLMGPSVARKVLARVGGNPDAQQAHFGGTAKAHVPPLIEPLSHRESEILQLVAQGLSNVEIANRLHLAEGTIKNYVSNILQKTGTRDRTQAVLRAQALGLVES